MRRDVFQAIADPTRRNILKLVSSTPMNVNSIAENFKMSRPAISQHVKILEECGLVEVLSIGRERHCRTSLSPLTTVQTWLQLLSVATVAPKTNRVPKAKATPKAKVPLSPAPHADTQDAPAKEKVGKKSEKKTKKKKAKKEGKKGKKGKSGK
ncbi:hypothetical protein BH10BAC6_BH10BAC6_09970 [soil metagenome]